MPATATARDAILDGAERLFARHGFAATTIKQIASDAGVNSALLYYYFGSKETLYHQVLARLFEDLVASGSKALSPDASPEASVRAFVRMQVAFLSGRPHMAKLLARELVDHDAAHAAGPIAMVAATLFQRLRELVMEGQRLGAFRHDVAPEFAAISTIAQVAYVFIARPAVGHLLGHGKSGVPDDVLNAFGEHAADFALAALRAPARDGHPSTRERA